MLSAHQGKALRYGGKSIVLSELGSRESVPEASLYERYKRSIPSGTPLRSALLRLANSEPIQFGMDSHVSCGRDHPHARDIPPAAAQVGNQRKLIAAACS